MAALSLDWILASHHPNLNAEAKFAPNAFRKLQMSILGPVPTASALRHHRSGATADDIEFEIKGFEIQKLEDDGWVFVYTGGTVVERDLGDGEGLHVDTAAWRR